MIDKGVNTASLLFTVAEQATNTLTQTTIDITDEFNSGEWIQVVGTIDLGLDTVRLFATGEDGFQAQANPVSTSATSWQSGFPFPTTGLGGIDGTLAFGDPFGPPAVLDAYQGEIAAYRFYETVLTASDVADNYHAVAGRAQVQTVTSANGVDVSINADGTFTYDPGATFDDLQVGGSATCLLYTSPSPRDATLSRMPSSA